MKNSEIDSVREILPRIVANLCVSKFLRNFFLMKTSLND